MSLRQKSDEAAAIAGVVTTGVLAVAGCPIVGAMAVGAVVAAIIDIPFGSITDVQYHGPVYQKHRVPKRFRPPLPKSILSRSRF